MTYQRFSMLCNPRLVVAAMVFVLTTAAGCVRFTQPILKDEQILVDNGILGKWVADDGKEAIEVLAPKGDDKTYEVHDTDKDGKEGRYLVRLGKIQDTMVAEMRGDDFAPQSSDEYKAHFLPLYSFLIVYQTKPNLVVSSLDSNWLKKYLDAHPNELKILEGEGDIIVTSPTEQIQAFILKHCKDDGAMGEKTTMVRPGDPTTRAAAK